VRLVRGRRALRARECGRMCRPWTSGEGAAAPDPERDGSALERTCRRPAGGRRCIGCGVSRARRCVQGTCPGTAVRRPVRGVSRDSVMPWERLGGKVDELPDRPAGVIYVAADTRQQVSDHGESTRPQYALGRAGRRALGCGQRPGFWMTMIWQIRVSAVRSGGFPAACHRDFPGACSGWCWARRCRAWHDRPEGLVSADRVVRDGGLR